MKFDSKIVMIIINQFLPFTEQNYFFSYFVRAKVHGWLFWVFF